MDKNKDKVTLNEELLDKVAGGFSTDFFDLVCPNCPGNPPLFFQDTDPTGRISYYRCGSCEYTQSTYT